MTEVNDFVIIQSLLFASLSSYETGRLLLGLARKAANDSVIRT
jgi:hypothetical protein